MHRNVFVFVALMAVDPALIGQSRPQDQPSAPVSSQQQQAPAQPQRHRRQESDQRVPAAQYSPLAAQGGYTHGGTSPLDAMVRALNPRDVNLGAVWEERRRVWFRSSGRKASKDSGPKLVATVARRNSAGRYRRASAVGAMERLLP